MPLLGDLVDIKGGGTPSKSVEEYWGGEIPWASVKDLKSMELTDTTDYITELGVEKSATRVVPSGTIIVPTRMALGKVAMTTRPMAINQDLKALLIKNEDQIHKRYLLRCIEAKALEIQKKGKGATVKGVSIDVLKELQIPLPEFTEQKRIAAVLDKADALSRRRQQAIDLADQFLRSVFLEMFGDPVSNPKGWHLIPFGQVGSLDRGKSKHRPRNDPALLGGDHPLIQTGDVANSGGYIREYGATYSDFGLQQSRKWPSGTLCITIAANIAKTGILKFDACFPDSVVGFKPNEMVVVEYVRYWLMFLQRSIEAKAPESAQKNINLQILRNLTIPVPPKPLQDQFASIVERGNDALEKAHAAKMQNEKLFNSLAQDAFG